MTLILDPTAEQEPIQRRLNAIEPDQIRSLALLDISKPRGDVLLDRIQERIEEEFPNLTVQRYTKPAFSKPAPQDLRSRIAKNNQMVLLALAD